MATKKEDAIVPVQEYAIMKRDPAEVMEAIATNLEGEHLTARDLTNIKVPTGGMIMWTVPTLKGDEYVPEINGIICAMPRINRARWEKPYGTGGVEPPVCTSMDGKTGIGSPGGSCASCPYAQFGSKIDEKGQKTNGQACKAVRPVFMLVPGKLLPLVVTAPPTSTNAVKDYLVQLTSEGIPFYAAISSLSLEKDKNANGIEYGKIKPRFVEELDNDQVAKLKPLVDKFREMLSTMNFAEADGNNPDASGQDSPEQDNTEGGGDSDTSRLEE